LRAFKMTAVAGAPPTTKVQVDSGAAGVDIPTVVTINDSGSLRIVIDLTLLPGWSTVVCRTVGSARPSVRCDSADKTIRWVWRQKRQQLRFPMVFVPAFDSIFEALHVSLGFHDFEAFDFGGSTRHCIARPTRIRCT
jgi:hypothetical protein